MKRFLLLLLFVSFYGISNSQVYYSQDFENGLGDMILIDVDKKTPNAEVAIYADAWNIRKINGSQWATSNSWFDPFSKADDWMITPVIKGVTASTFLTWNAFSSDAQYRDSYEVRVSLGDSTPAGFTKVLFTTAQELATVNKKGVSLKDYAGKDIRLAFRNISNDKFLINIDDILVSEVKANDLKLSSAKARKYVLKNTPEEISYEVTNNGSNDIKSMVIKWTDGIETKEQNITGITIKPFAKYTGKLSNKFIPIDATISDIKVSIVSINGGPNTSTEIELPLKIHGLDAKVQRMMVVEEATGTWCTWCPRGAVNMEKMRKEYPNEFIGIAVHNNDPMVNVDYDEGLTNLEGFAGFPSVVINREAIEDPADMEEYLKNTIRNESSPAIVNVSSTLAGKVFTVEGSVKFNTEFKSENLKLIAVLVEDGLKGTGSGWAQVNSYAGGANGVMGGYELLPNPVPANKMVYNEVGRQLLNGFEGKDINNGAEITVGDEVDVLFDFEAAPDVKVENAFIVLMVADGSGSIIGGGQTAAKLTNINDINEVANDISISPNPTTETSYLSLNIKNSEEVSIQILNQMGQIIGKKNYGSLSGNQVLPINLQDYSKGLYLVQLIVGNKQVTKKLMLN